MTGLYIHVPFCLSKCPYCDFYSVKYGSEAAREYKSAVIRNLRYYGELYGNIEFDTVYFGGGTPILLWKEITEILEQANIVPEAEITVEANPCCSDKENLFALRKAGVNRISFGVQSLNDNILKGLSRRHNAAAAVNAVKTASECGFDNISADLMLGVEGQSIDDAVNSIEQLSRLPVTHISAYMLKIEKGTPFAARSLKLPDEEEICGIYLGAVSQLEKNGYKQYEISNFSKKGFECRHNIKYWSSGEYLGIGPAAHSFLGGRRFFTQRDIAGFISAPYQTTAYEEDSKLSAAEEYAMLRLRLSEGLSLSEFEARGGDSNELIQNFPKIPREYYEYDGGRIFLTPSGFLVSNAVIGALLGL